jgi:hypothetical protein
MKLCVRVCIRRAAYGISKKGSPQAPYTSGMSWPASLKRVLRRNVVAAMRWFICAGMVGFATKLLCFMYVPAANQQPGAGHLQGLF